jgi:hypothetical protein
MEKLVPVMVMVVAPVTLIGDMVEIVGVWSAR